MNLPEIAIRRPVFAWMLMAGLILFGLISASRMGVSQLPDVDFPVVTVRVAWPGAAPEVIETNVVDIIEDAVMTVEGVRSVTSTSRYASASISVEFELSRNIADALQEGQNKVAAAQRHERFNCGLSYPPIRITDCEHEQRYGLSACAAQVNRGLPAIFCIAALELSPRKINIVHSPPPPEPRVLHGSGLWLCRGG